MFICCDKNMEQVSFNLPTSNIFLLNGQTVLFQNGAVNSQNVNGDLLQGEVYSKESSPKQLTNDVEGVQENAFEGGGFVIVKETQKESDCNLIQLTVQEAADLGIQFSLDSVQKNNSIIGLQNSKNQNLIFQKVSESLADKLNESTNTVSFITNDSLNEVNKIPCVSKSLNEYTILPQYVNGQIAYALQLSNQSDQVNTTQNIGIPITVPTMEVQSINPAENELSKLLSPVTLKTVVNKQKTGVTNSGAASVHAYIPNPNVRILGKVKQQELKKNQRKVNPINKDKYTINRQRKFTPQKILLPPLSNNGNELNGDNKQLHGNVADCSSSIKPNLLTNKRDTVANQLLLIVKENEVGIENNSSECPRQTLPNLTVVNENNSADSKVEQVLVEPQGSRQLPEHKISHNLPDRNESVRKLTPFQLMQVAAVLRKNSNNGPDSISNSSTLDDLETDTRIICRILYPEDFTPQVEKTPSIAKKRGRPQRKEPEEKPEKAKVEKGIVTRSGRVTRPPRHFFETYKRLRGDACDGSYSGYHSGPDENIENSPAVNPFHRLNLPQKRNFSTECRCPTCNKVYFGRVRMALHFRKYPDHCDSKQLELLKESSASEDGAKKGLLSSKGKGKAHRKLLSRLPLDKVLDSYNEKEVMHTCGRRMADMLSMWEMLLLRLESKDHNGKCKVQAFLDELGSFVKSVKTVSNKILRLPNCEQPSIHLEDDAVSSLLGLEKGWYATDDSVLSQLPFKEPNALPKEFNQPNNIEDCTTIPNPINNDITKDSTQSLLCKDEQDVVKVKEELLELDLLCVQDDPIGVDSVDQIVSERLKTMAPVDDLVSTLPAMPATSTDELVRGLLSDDLINSLETLIPPTHPPPDLDFTVLSSEFNTSR